MAREFRDPKLSKSDPMTTLPLKMPGSLMKMLKDEALRQQRSAAYLIREILADGMKKILAERAKQAGKSAAK